MRRGSVDGGSNRTLWHERRGTVRSGRSGFFYPSASGSGECDSFARTGREQELSKLGTPPKKFQSTRPHGARPAQPQICGGESARGGGIFKRLAEGGEDCGRVASYALLRKSPGL